MKPYMRHQTNTTLDKTNLWRSLASFLIYYNFLRHLRKSSSINFYFFFFLKTISIYFFNLLSFSLLFFYTSDTKKITKNTKKKTVWTRQKWRKTTKNANKKKHYGTNGGKNGRGQTLHRSSFFGLDLPNVSRMS